MVIQALKKGEKQTLLVIIFAIIVFLIIIVIFFGLIKGEKVTTPSGAIPAYISKTIKIDFEILKNPDLKKLQMFEQINLPETKGRDNPFTPYTAPIPIIIE